MKALLRQLRPAIVGLFVLTAVTGVAYPLVVLSIGQVAFADNADGSLIEVDGDVVGSGVIGQGFVSPQYFHPRPSSAGAGYDGAASSGSNMGPTNPEYLATVEERVAQYREDNDLPDAVTVPADAVTGSGSGLDPHISVANAELQAARVAAARGMSLASVLDMIDAHTDGRPLGILGDPGVNVLQLNVALDRR